MDLAALVWDGDYTKVDYVIIDGIIYSTGGIYVELTRLQALVGEWSRHNFDDQPSYRCLLGAMEELGELAHAHLKEEQRIREGSVIGMKMGKADAVADIIIFLADYCEREGIDLSHAVASTWWEVSKRDWKKFPRDGKTC